MHSMRSSPVSQPVQAITALPCVVELINWPVDDSTYVRLHDMQGSRPGYASLQASGARRPKK